MIASIPSPSSGVLRIGPLGIHAYGLMIALGVVAAVWLMARRVERAGTATKDDITYMAVRAVFAGVIGARLYHVVTDWEKFSGHPERIVQIWKGGLGIPGGVLAGTLVGLWALRRRGRSLPAMLTAGVPAIPLAQAIGRLGNWFNQELFGRPTTLPWGLEIDDEHLPAGFLPGTTFHPTFLYEMLWNLALCGVLLLIDRSIRLRQGRLFAVYVLGYGIGRLWIEGLRIDPAKSSGGLRLNQWMAIVLIVAGAGFLIWDWWTHRGSDLGASSGVNSEAELAVPAESAASADER